MARRPNKIREELAALDEEVGSLPAATGRVRKIVPVIVACVTVVSFSAITWYAYNQGILEGSEEAAPYLRPKGPLKIAPSSPGGVEVPNRDKFVYNRLENREDDQKVERLLPPPEQPKERPQPVSETAEQAPAASDGPVAERADAEAPVAEAPVKPRPRTANEALKKALDLIEKDAPPPLAPPGSVAIEAKPAGEGAVPATEEDTTQTAQAATGGGPIRLTPGPEVAPRTVPTPPPPAPPSVVSPSKAPQSAPIATKPKPKPRPKPSKGPTRNAATRPDVSTKGYYIQLAALRSQGAAEKAWRVAQEKNASLLGSRSLAIERAEVPGKGLYFRVQSGPMANGEAARALCSSLKKRGQGCFVVRRR